MKILVFNPTTNKMEKYYRSLSQNMPYANNLTVKEFRGSSKTDVIWTDKRLMEAWNKLRKAYGKPINVGYAFKRIGEGGHSNQSQHYAGTAMDIAQKLTPTERDKLRNLASSLGIFGYVEPKVLTPTWVNVILEYKIIFVKSIFLVKLCIFKFKIYFYFSVFNVSIYFYFIY